MSNIYVVFDGSHEGELHFVEVEDEDGSSIKFGSWIKREDGYWVLKIIVCEDCRNIEYDIGARIIGE